MKKIIYSVFLCFVILVSSDINAQNTANYEGMTWYLDKKEAFDSASVQRKQVVLFWGSNTCGVCDRVKKNLATESVKSILDEYYILWFCDATTYGKNSPEVSDYLSDLTSIPYPAICVIDTFDITIGYGLTTGEQSATKLKTMLSGYVDNEQIITGDDESINVYVSGSSLVIKTEISKEIVSIFTLNGSLVGRFYKTEYDMACDLSGYSKGIFLVNSSSGWTRKIVIR